MLGAIIKNWLAHPLMRGLDIDDPHTTILRRTIIQQKPFLRKIYLEWHEAIIQALPAGDDPVLEVGSGAGSLGELIPELITSELFHCPGTAIAVNATELPFPNASLRGIVMTDVLHHMTRPRRFFAEASRCVRAGGVIVMIEPWVSAWSSIIYRYFHHEPFHPESTEWEIPFSGPLSGANEAMAWMIFERDRALFEQEFPEWRIQRVKPEMPFRYLVSGGVSMRSLVPARSFRLFRWIEGRLEPWMRKWAMFAEIILVRDSKPAGNTANSTCRDFPK